MVIEQAGRVKENVVFKASSTGAEFSFLVPPSGGVQPNTA
jgi:hypothetical protein